MAPGSVVVTNDSQLDVNAKAVKRQSVLRVGPVVVSMAMISLVTLVIQNASLVLMTRHAKATSSTKEGFYTSTVVLNQEILKMFICLIMLAVERQVSSVSEYLSVLHNVVVQPECLKIALPAGLFTLQNFLIFLSLANLDVMTFQILSQTKILSAALFSVWLLNRRLNAIQWGSLVVLTGGVFLAQYDSVRAGLTRAPSADDHQHAVVGVISCIISGLSSSFAGVYFEKVVKTTPPSLAVRNIHLSVFGIPFALVSMLVLDVFNNQDPSGFRYFRGYSSFTWLLVCIHALGGLLVATVVKYADNILKGFATAVAIAVSGFFAWIFWAYVPSFTFVVGCGFVMVSVVLYQWADVRPAAPSQGAANSGGNGPSSPQSGGYTVVNITSDHSTGHRA